MAIIYITRCTVTAGVSVRPCRPSGPPNINYLPSYLQERGPSGPRHPKIASPGLSSLPLGELPLECSSGATAPAATPRLLAACFLRMGKSLRALAYCSLPAFVLEGSCAQLGKVEGQPCGDTHFPHITPMAPVNQNGSNTVEA